MLALLVPLQPTYSPLILPAGTHSDTLALFGGGPAPVRAYIPDLLPDILEGRIQPGRVFDSVVDLNGVPGGYRDMNDRKSLKVMVRP